MPFLKQCLVALAAILSGLNGVHADSGLPLTIKRVRFGFPSDTFVQEKDGNKWPNYLFKAARWAPIQIWVDVNPNVAFPTEDMQVIVATPDGDDVISEVHYPMPVPASGQGVRLPTQLYLKPGGILSELTVRVIGASSGKPLAEPYRQSLLGLPSSRYLILSAGRPLSNLRLPKSEGQAGEDSSPSDEYRNGWVQLAHTGVDQLPDRWFGFEAVDLLVLNAADDGFWQELAQDKSRSQALFEWVSRGGRLLISGSDALHCQRLLEGRHDLPIKVDPEAKRSVNEIAIALPNSTRLVLKGQAKKTIPVVNVRPIADRPFQIRLLNDERGNAFPLVVQAPYGLGRITLVTFDLDRPPFDDSPHREAFWEWLINAAGTRLPSGLEPISYDSRNVEEDAYLTRMQNNLEFFEGVPVVSFGWVALLILVYILLIGPLEYLVLKRLLKRMELTWITFPIIVATVCVSAYLAAVELKGRELKINKIDLVEIDLQGKRVYGQTWFTLFSPNIQNFTIGVEPSIAECAPADTLVSWHGKAKSVRQSLFRRTYEYHTSVDPNVYANGLEKVPIQVWSTKSFTGNWAANLAEPLIESDLRIAAADASQLTGSITSRLPFDVIVDAQLFYRERVTPLPPLLRGVPRYVSTNAQAANVVSWLHKDIPQKDLLASSQTGRVGPVEFKDDPNFRLWPMLFHDVVQGQFGRLYNSSVRELDQSWRIAEKNPNNAILVARLRRREGPAEDISQAPDSPTRLWLNGIPGVGARAPIDGTIRQETYIRVLIPILPTK